MKATMVAAQIAFGVPVIVVPPYTPVVISNVVVSAISDTGATVSWDVAPGCQGQLEYGLTAGYGSLHALETNYLTHHVQTITGLTPATTYHYRIKCISVDAVTQYTTDATFDTAGPISQPGVYGQRAAPASLAALQYLTDAYISTFSQWKPTSGTIYTMPTDATTKASQSSQDSWLATVPAGSVNNPSIIVMTSGNTWTRLNSLNLDSSHPYTIIWGYGAKLHMTGTGSTTHSGIRVGGDTPSGPQAHHQKIFGLEIYGNNLSVMTGNAFAGSAAGSTGEGAAAVLINGNVADLEVADCKFHGTYGDSFYFYPCDGPPYIERPYARIVIHHNELGPDGRDMAANPSGQDLYFVWNYIHDCANSVIDWEDDHGGLQHFNRVFIRDNIIDGWFWWNQQSDNLMSLGYDTGRIASPVTELYIERNQFRRGYQQVANISGNGNCMFIGWSYQGGTGIRKTGVYIRNNDYSGIPSNKKAGNFVYLVNVTTAEVTGNTGIGTMGIGQSGSNSGIVISANSA